MSKSFLKHYDLKYEFEKWRAIRSSVGGVGGVGGVGDVLACVAWVACLRG